MKKEPLFGSFLILLIAASGCINLGFLGTREPEAAAFVGGTEGLKLSFADLPSAVFQNQQFAIMLLVENAGEYDIGEGNAHFTLSNADALGVTKGVTKTNKAKLSGVKVVDGSVIPGGKEQLSWGPAKVSGPVLARQQAVPFSIDSCYNYESFATSKVCIGRSEKVCRPSGGKAVQSSGAPVQVTGLRQVAIPKDPSTISLGLVIDVENVGKGNVFSPSEECPSPSSKGANIVSLKALKLGNKDYLANCEQRSISLFEGKGSVSCSFDIRATEDFEEQLGVELEYKYKQRLKGQIAVIPS